MWYPFLVTRNSSRAGQPMSRENVTGLLRRLQDFVQIKIENIYLFKLKKNMETSLKAGFAQFSLAAQKIWVAQNFGGLQPPWPVRLCLCDQGHQDKKLRR